MLKYLIQIWNSKDLRRKILFTIGCVIVARIAAHITIPNVNTEALDLALKKNQLLGVFSILTGGSLDNFSVRLMGLSPYINASIIIQLLTVIVPRLESLSKEGDQGRKKLNQYTRWLSLPLAFIQSYGMILIINQQAQGNIINNLNDPKVILPIMLTVMTGTIFLMWLGEVMTERGIGNGISILIMVNILSSVPAIIGQNVFLSRDNSERLIPFIIMILATIILSIIVMLVTEAYRKIPVTYAGKKVKGEKSVLPIKVNQAGMIPIIFAISVVSFPSIVAQLFLMRSNSETLKSIGQFFTDIFTPTNSIYHIAYFILIIAFTYFYVSITFNPQNVADNLQKRGGFIPGIRPGKQTADYLYGVSNHLNLFGGLFIGFIAVAPILIQQLFRSSTISSIPLLISGAGLIIIIGVILDIIRQINSQLIMHDYEKLY